MSRRFCQVCGVRYGSLKAWTDEKKVFTEAKQHIHHLIPRRWLAERGIHEHWAANLLSVCDKCHGRAKEPEDCLFRGDVYGFMEGMKRANFPIEKILRFVVTLEFKEFEAWNYLAEAKPLNRCPKHPRAAPFEGKHCPACKAEKDFLELTK